MIKSLITRAILAFSVLCCALSFNSKAVAADTSSFSQALLPAYLNHGVVDLQKSVEVAQDAFEDTYFQKLLQDERFFDDAYNNNLVITTEINWDFARNGVIFMRLIDFLEKKDDPDAKLMLGKLNELFYLLFHRHLSHIDLPKDKQVHLVHALHYLFGFKNERGEGVLRSHLTRIFIYAMMVEVMGLPYYEKKEVLFFAFEDFRSVLEKSVANLPNNSEAFVAINVLINDFAAYGMKEPVLKPKNFKKWFITGLVIAAIVGVCYYIGTWDRFKAIVNDLVESATKTFSETLVKNFSEPTAEAMVRKMQENGAELGKTLGGGAADAFTQRGEDLGRTLGGGIADGLAHEDVDAVPVDPRKKRPNRNTKKLARMLGNDLGEGFKEQAPGLAEGLLEGLTHEPVGKSAPTGKRSNRNLKKLTDAAGRGIGIAVGDALEDAGISLPVIGGVKINKHADRVKADKAAAARRKQEIESEDADEEPAAATRGGARAGKPPRGRRSAAPAEGPAGEDEGAAAPEDHAAPKPRPARAGRGGRKKAPAATPTTEEHPTDDQSAAGTAATGNPPGSGQPDATAGKGDETTAPDANPGYSKWNPWTWNWRKK